MRLPRPLTALAVLLVIVLAAAVGLGVFAVTYTVRGTAEPKPTPTTPAPTPSAVASATLAPSAAPASTASEPSASGVAAALAQPLRDPRLGTRVRAEVVDGLTGALLLGRDANVPAAPASTAKILTATAVLAVHKPADRITTTVVAGSRRGTVVLVGGGDPTLTAAAPGTASPYPDAARVSDLAAQLRKTYTGAINTIVIDHSLYDGSRIGPGWAPEDIPSDYAAPITSLMVDGGRDTPNAIQRSTQPDVAAGKALARALGVPNAAIVDGTAPPGATTLASVQSAPIGELIEQMLQISDNVIAECLARQVAIAEGQPVSFAGAVAAIRAVLGRLGVNSGAGMVDGSGLSADDRLSPAALTGVIRTASNDARLVEVIGDLPVAAWNGTLAGRYQEGRAVAGAGLVQAKTGTLTSVSSLAGVVQDADGRLLIFAVIADQVGATEADTDHAEAALDVVAATLATCGCR